MHVATVYKIINIVFFWTGITLIFRGATSVYESGYTPPKTPVGWVAGMVWISFGGIMATCWLSYVCAHILHQKCAGKPRWSTSKIIATSLPLLAAACFAVIGTYVTWQHPYRLGPCDCASGEWGPNCEPCLCGEHGVCHSGTFGTGQCFCDFNWGGPTCDECGTKWKGENCDVCKTGFTNAPSCNKCARGYDGEECDVCAEGWQPWQHSSDLFPQTISDDDDRHLCDECMPNHWGYECKKCPIGNDVPHMTLDKNNPIQKGTRVATTSGKVGHITDMQVQERGVWKHRFNYSTEDPLILDHVKIKMRFDRDRSISNWILFKDLRGVQCNNRGVCEDDAKHQLDFPDWDTKCTPTLDTCTTNSDCTVSENCKGICQGLELPIPAIWAVSLPEGKICSTDEDCIDKSIVLDAANTTYTGGRCISRTCCQESYHGNGKCECDSTFFGRLDPTLPFRHDKISPACDFCPGYDWVTGEPSSICSGGKGTCTPSYSRDGDYLKTRCTCGFTAYIDPITKIPDTTRKIRWYKELCQCGDWDNDLECDTCASGYWGPNCQQCPGGFGLRACSGHGRCDGSGSNAGTGRCDCDVKEYTSWMLAPYVKRYSTEVVGLDDRGEDKTCSECAPNFWGPQCRRCDETDEIKASELKHIFQPSGSFSLGVGMSSAEPIAVCHPDKPWICSLACGRGGWCNWGRTGDGSCMCWSNKPLNPTTWNPLDNVCIGNDRYNGTLEDYKGYGEQCPSYGYCSEGDSSRETTDLCGDSPWTESAANDYDRECQDQMLGVCYPWQQMDFTVKSWGFSCTPT